jgi:hypothetical protein
MFNSTNELSCYIVVSDTLKEELRRRVTTRRSTNLTFIQLGN